jgi:Na+/pantothenate symporter
MASLSLAVNLVLYFMFVMFIPLSDASNLLTNYMGTSYMVAVLISVFADIFIGRYMTVIISSLIELVVRITSDFCLTVYHPQFRTIPADGFLLLSHLQFPRVGVSCRGSCC